MVELYSGENAQKKWEKNNPLSASQCRIGKSHAQRQNFKQRFDKGSSLVDISTPRVRFPLSFMDIHDGFLYSCIPDRHFYKTH